MVMNYDEVCTWLGLPPGSWPPNYYDLLGLQPGESNTARIEQHVQERMFLLRCRQLSRPELSTEAMNLLAKAFACLTDAASKQSYDAALWKGGRSISVTPAPNAKPTVESVFAAPNKPLAWMFGMWGMGSVEIGSVSQSFTVLERWVTAPPPQRLPLDVAPTAMEAAPAEERNGQWSAPAPAEATGTIAPTAEPPDPVEKLATSLIARQGLGTKRALYERLARTRHLYRAWNAAGKYLSEPERRLAKSTEAVELARLLTFVRRRLRDFPPLLGEAGQPGFYVVTLASQPRKGIVATFRMLLPSQREMLTRDWRDGVRLLAAHRRFVREEIRSLRRKPWVGRAFRAIDVVLSDHPGWLLGAIVLVALAVATWLGLTR